MKRTATLVILAASPLLMAALWMDEQPSYKVYEAPVLTPPRSAVPISGKEIESRRTELQNPVISTKESLAQGKLLFAINCAMCHGNTSAMPGFVGQKLKPPPPGLDPDLVKSRSDSAIFNAITFGFGRMPPFQDKLLPQERWSLVNFIRTRK